MSRIGSIPPSTWVTSPPSKQRTTWAMASHSRILARNWLPRPSPLAAPRTSPAISTNVSRVGMISLEPAIFASSSRRWSGTATSPTLGSMVQKGIIGRLGRGGLRQSVEQGRFADIGQTDDAAIETHRRSFLSVRREMTRPMRPAQRKGKSGRRESTDGAATFRSRRIATSRRLIGFGSHETSFSSFLGASPPSFGPGVSRGSGLRSRGPRRRDADARAASSCGSRKANASTRRKPPNSASITARSPNRTSRRPRRATRPRTRPRPSSQPPRRLRQRRPESQPAFTAPAAAPEQSAAPETPAMPPIAAPAQPVPAPAPSPYGALPADGFAGTK